MRPNTFIAVGGTQDCRGGVEIFMQRLAAVWPTADLGPLLVLPANTAWLKSARRVLGSAGRWMAALARVTVRILPRTRRAPRVTVWYHYSNVIDLAAVLWISLFPGVRLLVTPHCSLTWRHLSGAAGRWLTLRVLRRTSGLLVLSEEQRRFFARTGVPVTRIRTLLQPHGGECLPFRLRPAGSFMFAGRVSREKGIPQMLQFMKTLCRGSPHFKLDIFGAADPEMRALLEEATRADPLLSDALRIRGAASPERIAAELGGYRYLLHLSTVDAFPLAVLEAITAGTVPVVFELPGTSEIIDRWGGISAGVDDIEQLAAAVRANESAENTPGVRSAEAARYYSAAAVAREILQTMETSDV